MTDAWSAMLVEGGWVVIGILTLSVSLWSVVVLRFEHLYRDERVLHRFLVEGAHVVRVDGGSPSRLDLLAKRASHGLRRYRRFLRALVAAAPLLGLFGTVDGMIETFASLHGPSWRWGPEETVAGGISRALLTTQLGLVVGVPGLVAARFLERREAEVRRRLLEARASLGARSDAA
ncbi:MAG: MotA/TolQ/ExbB proton channel family protein [Myxococcota bacterium]